MTDPNTSKTRWTDADFDSMGWHDCTIHALGVDQDGECQSDLVLDLDYIVEWIETPKGSFRFRVAPAILRFPGVDKLHVQTLLAFGEGLEIDSIDRVPCEDETFPDHYHWTIGMHTYWNDDRNRIEFDATGFVQALTGPPVVTYDQCLTPRKREKLKKSHGTRCGRAWWRPGGRKRRNALQPPPLADTDPSASEVLRIWAAPKGPQQVALRTHWQDAGAWGLLLADVARHATQAYERDGRNEEEVLDRIFETFDAEWSEPTDDPKDITDHE